MALPDTFTDCRCPECQHPLDDVATAATECPFCHQPLNRLEVWSTRQEPNQINLPGWLRAFGWPFLLMLAGATVFVLKFGKFWPHPTRGWMMTQAEILFALGLVHFLYKFAMDGDD